MIPLRDDIFTRANGDRVAFSEYGDVNGEPVMFCHGWPSSRIMAQFIHDAARELRVRIIAPDRPGIADSSFASNRKVLDWPPLVSELADFLKLERFRVLGISGGAPYAYALAWALPEQVRAITVVSGAPDIAELSDHSGLLPLYRWLMWTEKQLPPTLCRLGFRLVRPFLSLRPPRRSRPWLLKCLQPFDADSLRDEKAFESCFESQRLAWKTSAEGVMADAQLFAQPWGFSLSELRVPVRLWHGDSDRSFSVGTAREMAKKIPNCNFRMIERAGHYSVPIRHIHEILQDLIAV
jgi:pimeloyl-ACP methyl ester carboxylesterase